jgi:hypothetical protein
MKIKDNGGDFELALKVFIMPVYVGLLTWGHKTVVNMQTKERC